jgi:hypothetical protein
MDKNYIKIRQSNAEAAKMQLVAKYRVADPKV